jgi:hypothetical protein
MKPAFPVAQASTFKDPLASARGCNGAAKAGGRGIWMSRVKQGLENCGEGICGKMKGIRRKKNAKLSL